jgi:outer membrane protein, heavy metal efflux system
MFAQSARTSPALSTLLLVVLQTIAFAQREAPPAPTGPARSMPSMPSTSTPDQPMQSMPGMTMPGMTMPGTPAQAPPGQRMSPDMPALPPSATAGRMTGQPAQPADHAVAPTFGLVDFENLALQRNPTLKQAAAQFDAALHRSRQAGLYPNPTVGYIQDQIGSFSESQPTSGGFAVRGKPSPGDNVGAFIQWQIVTAGKLRLSRAKFAEEATAARWQAIGQELRVLNAVRIQYFEVLAAQRMIAIHREIVKLDDDAVRTAREMFNVGQAGEPEVIQARVQERRAKVALQKAENRFRGDWEELVAVAGAPDFRPVPLDVKPLEAEVAPLSFDGTLTDLLHNSPELQAALSEIRRDEIMVRRERVEPIPNVQFQAVTGFNYEFGVQTAGVQIGIALPIFNRNQGTIREAMSDLSRDHAEFDRIALSLRERLAEVFTHYQNAAHSVADYRSGTLPMARQAYEMQVSSYRQRRTPWPQVISSRRMYFDLTKDYVESLLELRRAEVEIGGMLLVDGLATPPSPTSQGHIEAVATPR